MKCSLEEILKFRHDGVIKRFSKMYNVSVSESEVVFSDLMRFFWASEKHEFDRRSNINKDLDFVFIMDEAMRPIDEIWHIFLLYTKEYMDFCEKYFGQYIHHLPDIVPNLDNSPDQFEVNLERFLNFTYDNLGHDTVERWFAVQV